MASFESSFLESSAKFSHVETIKKSAAEDAAIDDTFHSCTFPSEIGGDDGFTWKLELCKGESICYSRRKGQVPVYISLTGVRKRNKKRENCIVWHDLFVSDIMHKKGWIDLPGAQETLSVCTEISLSDIPAGEFTVGCNIVIFELPSDDPRFTDGSSCTLRSDLKKLHADMKHSDVVITAGGREFQAHKSILSARSNVFSVMFGNGFQEGRENRVEIADVEPETLEWLLRFLYTDELPPDMDAALACKLLVVSDRYAVDRLKNLAEAKLTVTLTVANIVEVLQLAHLHAAVVLKKVALEFVAKHFREISKTAEWKELRSKNIPLIDEVMDLMSKKWNQ